MNEEILNAAEEHLHNGNIKEAQQTLDSVAEHDARWHFIQSEIFKAKNWYNESKKQLEIAVSLEPDNERYKNALNELRKTAGGQETAEKKKKKPQMGKANWKEICCEVSGECCCMGCCELGCTALCEGIGSGC